MYVKVIPDLPVKQIDKAYDYLVPKIYENKIDIGMRVVINFNGQQRMAYVIGKGKNSEYANKEIAYLLDETPTLTRKQLKLIEDIKERAFSSYEEAFRAVVPTNLMAVYEKRFEVIDENLLSKELKSKIKEKYLYLEDIMEEDYQEINNLLAKKIIIKNTLVKSKSSLRRVKLLSVIDENVVGIAENKLINRLKTPDLYQNIIKEKYSKTLIKKLINDKKIKEQFIRKDIQDKNYLNILTNEIILNNTQLNVVNNFDYSQFEKHLLVGNPASGKTIVYLEIIKKLVKENKQALIIVPERSLIPLIAARVKEIFSSGYRIYDNELTPAEKLIVYDEVRNNDVNVIVGTKTALFLPYKNLSFVVLDEAHDNGFIQNQTPYYDAKVIGEWLAKSFKCPLMFVTATPTIEMIYDSSIGILKKHSLDDLRTFKPQVQLINMKQELIKGNNSILSETLRFQLKETLKKKEQAIILVNKRGYAPFVMCRSCGYVESCPNCEKSLVYHKVDNKLVCNSCNYKKPYKESCSVCGENKVRPVGFGLEQAYQLLKEEFKEARIILLDSVSTTKKGMVNKILSDFNEQKGDILIGTQMVSKGHHYENVSLVAVLLADQMLKMNSFLANERTYQLLNQHIGRLRGTKAGRAVIQTYNEDHFVLRSIKTNDDKLFYESEIKLREKLKYPPFYNVAKVSLRGNNERNIYNKLNFLKMNLQKQNTQLMIIGPSEDYIKVKNNLYNFDLIIKAPKRYDIMALLTYISKKYKTDNYKINIYDDSL